MSNTHKTVNDRIKETREDLDLKQSELSDRIYKDSGIVIDQQRLSRIENGAAVYAEELIPIANALGKDPWWLLTEIHNDHYVLANELGLSDDTLTILREKQLDAVQEESIFGVNQFAIAIDSIVSNPELIALLITYFYSSLDTLTVDNLDNHYSKDEAPFLYVKADRVYSFPVSDFEQLYRLQLMDELKKTREALYGKRKDLLSEYRNRINQVAKSQGTEKIANAVVKAMCNVDSKREEK